MPCETLERREAIAVLVGKPSAPARRSAVVVADGGDAARSSIHLEHRLDEDLAGHAHPRAGVVAPRGRQRGSRPLSSLALALPVLEKTRVDHRGHCFGIGLGWL